MRGVGSSSCDSLSKYSSEGLKGHARGHFHELAPTFKPTSFSAIATPSRDGNSSVVPLADNARADDAHVLIREVERGLSPKASHVGAFMQHMAAARKPAQHALTLLPVIMDGQCNSRLGGRPLAGLVLESSLARRRNRELAGWLLVEGKEPPPPLAEQLPPAG